MYVAVMGPAEKHLIWVRLYFASRAGFGLVSYLWGWENFSYKD